jgi:hypothetical protein
MTTPPGTGAEGTAGPSSRAERAAGKRAADERARRRAEVFGDVLPQTTGDERAPGEEPGDRDGGTDDWLRRQVPPHHG